MRLKKNRTVLFCLLWIALMHSQSCRIWVFSHAKAPKNSNLIYQSSFASFSLKLKSRFGRTMTLALLNDKNRNIFNLKTLQGFPILVLENERQIRY